MVGRDESGSPVEVRKVQIARSTSQPAGHLAWWTGDLGVRANIATHDAWAGRDGDPLADRFRRMVSQAADPSLIEGGPYLPDDERRRLASKGSTAFTAAGGEWSRRHWFDLTVDAQGVLADVAQGGLKRDLTAYLGSGGTVRAWEGLPGLIDADPMAGHVEPGPEPPGMPAPRRALACCGTGPGSGPRSMAAGWPRPGRRRTRRRAWCPAAARWRCPTSSRSSGTGTSEPRYSRFWWRPPCLTTTPPMRSPESTRRVGGSASTFIRVWCCGTPTTISRNENERTRVIIFRADGESPRRPLQVLMLREPVGTAHPALEPQ